MAKQRKHQVERQIWYGAKSKFLEQVDEQVEERIMYRVAAHLKVSRHSLAGACLRDGRYGQVCRQVSGSIMEQTWGQVWLPIERELGEEDYDG